MADRRARRSRGRRPKRKPSGKKRIATGGFYDYSLLFLVIFLVCFGLIMIYSTSYYSATIYKSDPMYYLKRQGLLAAAGVVAMIIVSKIDYRKFLKPLFKSKMSLPVLLMLLSILLQIYVLINGVDLNGAKRWISLGPLGTFQPSDFAKVATIIFVAYVIYQKPSWPSSLQGFMRISVLVGIDIVLIAVENVSTAIVMCLILGGMCFVASYKKGFYFLIVGLGVFAFAMVIIFGEGFRLGRVVSWLNVETDDGAFQILQGLYAIASGGVFGKGLGQSVQKLGFVPEAQNDMIFTIICEELGLVGACVVLLLFIMVLWRIFQIVVNSPDLFGGMIGVGVLIHLAAQVLLNVAVVTNTIPSTGVALPFISYGGTSVAMLLVEVGLVLSVSNQVTAE